METSAKLVMQTEDMPACAQEGDEFFGTGGHNMGGMRQMWPSMQHNWLVGQVVMGAAGDFDIG